MYKTNDYLQGGAGEISCETEIYVADDGYTISGKINALWPNYTYHNYGADRDFSGKYFNISVASVNGEKVYEFDTEITDANDNSCSFKTVVPSKYVDDESQLRIVRRTPDGESILYYLQ